MEHLQSFEDAAVSVVDAIACGEIVTDEAAHEAFNAQLSEDGITPEKADAYAYVLRKKKAEAKFLDDEIKRLQARKKALENAANGLKQYILYRFEKSGTDKVKGRTSSLSVKTSESVLLTIDAEQLPEEYQRVKTTVEANKALIKEHLDAGVVLDYASIGYGRSLTVR